MSLIKSQSIIFSKNQIKQLKDETQANSHIL
jgi:hypothetical protein